MFMIPFVAVVAAAILLLPLLKRPATAGVKTRLLLNGGIFMTAAVLMVTMTALGIAAEQPQTDTDVPSYADAADREDYAVSYVDNYAGAPNETASSDNNLGMGYLAAALATGLSCVGAGIAIASTAPAAIGAFSEDPKAFGKALIFVVLGEGVALYGLLISILLINKL